MEVLFPNGNCACLVTPPAGFPATSILKALDIEQPKGVIIVVGGAAGLEETMKGLLIRLFSCGIAFAAASSSALIIDGGTNAGVMAMMGQGVVDQGRKSHLLGIAPAGKVTFPGGPAEGSIEDGAPLDPNHSHFVLVESNEWGSETATMFEMIKAGKLSPGKLVSKTISLTESCTYLPKMNNFEEIGVLVINSF